MAPLPNCPPPLPSNNMATRKNSDKGRHIYTQDTSAGVESHFPKEMLHNLLGIPRYLKFLGKASHTDHISGSQHYSEPSSELY